MVSDRKTIIGKTYSCHRQDRPESTSSYNIVTDLGTAASRVYFHLKAEAVEWESKWSDFYIQGLTRPYRSQSAASLIHDVFGCFPTMIIPKNSTVEILSNTMDNIVDTLDKEVEITLLKAVYKHGLCRDALLSALGLPSTEPLLWGAQIRTPVQQRALRMLRHPRWSKKILSVLQHPYRSFTFSTPSDIKSPKSNYDIEFYYVTAEIKKITSVLERMGEPLSFLRNQYSFQDDDFESHIRPLFDLNLIWELTSKPANLRIAGFLDVELFRESILKTAMQEIQSNTIQRAFCFDCNKFHFVLIHCEDSSRHLYCLGNPNTPIQHLDFSDDVINELERIFAQDRFSRNDANVSMAFCLTCADNVSNSIEKQFYRFLAENYKRKSVRNNLTLDDLDFSPRTFNCLKRAGITTVADIVKISYEDMTKVRNMGKKSLDEIIRKLSDLGLTLQKNEAEKSKESDLSMSKAPHPSAENSQ